MCRPRVAPPHGALFENGFYNGEASMVNIWEVFAYSIPTVLASGLGALPFFFVAANKISSRLVALANCIAAGVMTTASFNLIYEALREEHGEYGTIVGFAIGVVFILLCKHYTEDQHLEFGSLKGADARKAIMVVAIMTFHSFAEGLGIGVSWGGRNGDLQGRFVSLALAIHNIPEGLATSLVLVPKGETPTRAAFWCIMSSAPQALVAVPAYVFVTQFRFLLPVGLGIAGGAMIWLVVAEIIPDAFKGNTNTDTAATVFCASVVLMLIFDTYFHETNCEPFYSS